MQITNANTILVTFLMQLGDLILTTPFLTALRKASPNAKIVYLVDEKWLDIVSENPDIDEVLTIDRKGKDKGFFALWQYSRKLQKYNFDMVINLNPSERCTFLAAFSGAKYKIGSSHRFFRLLFDKVYDLNRQLHAADMYLDVLKYFGIKDLSNDGLKIIAAEKNIEEANSFFANNNLQAKNNIIGFNIGSASATKRWMPDKFAQVADYFMERDYKVVFFGSSNELPMVNETIDFMKYKPIIATGKLDLGALVVALSRLNVLITNDSGPMHIAISQEVPIVALYGPSKPELYGPYCAKKAIVVRANPLCIKCLDRMKHECDDMSCMKNITVESVINATNEILQ